MTHTISRRTKKKQTEVSEVYFKRRDTENEEFLCDIQSHAKAFLGVRREAAAWLCVLM